MDRKPDIAGWYDQGDNALAAAVDWLVHSGGGWKRQLDFLEPRLREHGLTSVLEFGPGSGLLARGLRQAGAYEYLGVEKSLALLARCTSPGGPAASGAGTGSRAPGAANGLVVAGDVRTFAPAGPFDCACAFRFMKHFALDEWGAVLGKVLACGRYAAFDVQTLPADLDDGVEFPHAFVRAARVEAAVRDAGHEVLAREAWHEAELPGHGALVDVAYWTRRRDG